MTTKFAALFQPLKIGSVTIKNRFCVGPMGHDIYGSRGEYSEQGITYLVERAKGGFGLIYGGAFFPDQEVDPYDPISSPGPMYSPSSFRVSALRLNERLRVYDTAMFPQISMGLGRNYAGLYAAGEVDLTFMPGVKSQAISKDQIKKKIESMVKCAALMKSAEFPGMEVHALHWGYLLDQFAMSITNNRTDEYGGSLENRLRVCKEIIDGIRQECGTDFAVSMRMGLKSYINGLNQASLTGEEEAGRTIEEGVRICQLLEEYGYDVLSVDAGVYDSFYHAAAPVYMPKGHLLELSAEAKKVVNIPILLGSRMNDPYLCAQALADGKADGFVLARASLADPYFPRKMEMGIPEKIRPCIACNQACLRLTLTKGLPSSCAVNPAASRELNYGIVPALQSKKVVVVGGGVAGMEAARTAKLSGHDVALYEKSNILGGALNPAGAHSFKKELHELKDWYQLELKDLDIPVHLGEELSAAKIKKMAPDAVILAVGAVPITPNIPGMNQAVGCLEVLSGKKDVGQNVVVVGGGVVGCEMAIGFAQEGKQVTIVEALPEILAGGDTVPLMDRMMINDMLTHYNVKIMTGHKITAVNADGAVVEPAAGGKAAKVAADSVVIAIGFRPQTSMANELTGSGMAVYEVGDGVHVANVMDAVWSAYEVARSL